MAIKISGNTVIDNSRNINVNTFNASSFVGDGSQLTNLNLPDEVLKPTNTNPTDGATGESFTPTLCGSAFFSLYDKSHANTQFQVSIDSGFSNTEVDVFANGVTELVVPSSLSANTEHFFRVRYFDEDGCCSCFSDATCFTTVALPSTLGESTFGGFYMGTICAAGSCYYLIMAPNASGCACCQWKTVRTCSNVGPELCDGYGNTYDHLANDTHPAGNWTATRSIGGFSDWYLPALCELGQLYTNQGSSPAGEGFNQAGGSDSLYWSSTEVSQNYACRLAFINGSVSNVSMLNTYRVRAIRRVPF